MISLLTENNVAQNEDKIRVILEASDIKKLEKADLYVDDADRLMEEANQLYLETFTVQGNYELDEKTKGKKAKQLEEQARQKITEASALYQKGNEVKYGLYKTYIEKFWSGYRGDETAFVNAKLIEEQSNDFYYQALTNRTEANKMPDGNEKVQKLNQAADFESRAIGKQIDALGLYYGIDLKETPAEEVSPVEAFAEPNQKETIETTETLQPAEQYQPVITEQPQPAQPEEQYQPAIAEQPQPAQPEGQYQPMILNQDASDVTVVEPEPQQTAVEEIPLTDNERQVSQTRVGAVSLPAGLIFRIQIAAARAPMTREQIVRIYPGPYAVEMVEEEGWYKYQLMGMRLYSDALTIIKDIPINGAFISAYNDGDKINLYQGVIKNHNLERTVKSYGRKNLRETEYHVQIAASKFPLKQDDLYRFYSGPETVVLIIEDGWYKYRIKTGNSYELAQKIKAECGVQKAYIVPYKRGLKIEHASIRLNE